MIGFLEEVIQWIGELCAKIYFRVAAAAIFVITFLRWIYNTISYSLSSLYTQFDSLVENGSGALDQLINGTGGSAANKLALVEIAALINTFIPLEEAMAYFSAIFSLWGIIHIFRWGKSLIPTLSN